MIEFQMESGWTQTIPTLLWSLGECFLVRPEDAQMHDGATPLLAAALQGHVEVVWGS